MPENNDDNNYSSLLNMNFFQEKSKFEIIEEKIKTTIFGVLNILLEFDDDSFFSEVLSLLNETCQFLYYAFYEPMAYLWKNDTLFNAISGTLAYFQTVVFFNDTQLYIVFFYLIILLIVLVVADIFYVSYILSSKNKSGAVWPMRLLRSVVTFIVTVLFNPMVEFLLAILECSDKDENGNYLGYYQNYNVDDMHCWTDANFTVMVVLSIVVTIVFIVICTIVQTIFYETKTSEDSKGAKTNSKADLVSLAVKIALIIIFSFLVWERSLHWIVVPSTLFCGFIQFWIYWIERPFYEERSNTAFLVHTGVVLWSFVVLFFIKVLENSAFDGGIYLFFVGIPIVWVIVITQKDDRFKLLLTNVNKFQSGESVFKQIRYFIELVEAKYKDRRSNILLKGYIALHEEYCTIMDCPLKKYLKEIEKTESFDNSNNKGGVNYTNYNTTQTDVGGSTMQFLGATTTIVNSTVNTSSAFGMVNNEADLYLYQYAQEMYQNGISKFPYCTMLRINYAFFLMDKMKNSKKSLIELRNCEKYSPSFEEQFIIFRFLQNQGGDIHTNDDEDDLEDEEERLDIVSNLAYKNYFDSFKRGLTDITELYTNFWSLLLSHSTSRSSDDLIKMSEYGEQINKCFEDIKKNYTEMEKLKYNDEEVLSLYTMFFQDILNDSNQSEYYRKRLQGIQQNKTKTNNDAAGIYGNDADFVGLPICDEFEYIFVSAEPATMGTIIKISLGVCTLFGYGQADLVGKHVNSIMPDMYHDLHNQLFINKVNKCKSSISTSKSNIKSPFKEVFAFGKNKFKYAVPLAMKVNLMATQDHSELYFSCRIMNDDLYNEIAKETMLQHNVMPSIINFNMKICYVLTDLNFIVQYYTVNAVNFLGFKSNTAGNMDITKSISDLNQVEAYDNGKHNKRDWFKEKYFEPKLIIWKTAFIDEDEEKQFMFNNKAGTTNDKLNVKGLVNYSKRLKIDFGKTNSGDNKNGRIPLKRQRNKEDYFMMGVSEMNMLGKCVGYVFRFEVAKGDEDLFEDDECDDKEFFGAGMGYKEEKKKDLVEVNPFYVPRVDKKFDLDTRKLWFVQEEGFYGKEIKEQPSEDDSENVNNAKTKNWHEKLRDFAHEKIRKYKEMFVQNTNYRNNLDESNSDESNESDDYSDSDNSSDDYSDESDDDNNNNSLNSSSQVDDASQESSVQIGNDDNNNKNNSTNNNGVSSHVNNNDVYYNVKCLDKIKFSIFDFKKGKMVEVPKIQRESQVEYRKKEYLPIFATSKNSKHQSGDDAYNVTSKSSKDLSYSQKDKNNDENESKVLDFALIKQIEFALQKEESLPEMFKLKWISFLTFVAMLVISILFLVFLVSAFNQTKNNFNVVYDNHELITNILSGLFFIQELSLLNTPNFTNLIFSNEYTSQNISNSLSELFTNSYQLQQQILTSPIELSDNRINVLLKGKTNIKVIESSSQISNSIEVIFNAAITNLLTSMHKLIHVNITSVNNNNSDIFFYINNVFHPVIDGLMENANNLIREYTNGFVDKFEYKNWVIIAITIALCMLSWFLIRCIYSQINIRKTSYLEVFFEISEVVCRKALDKCEGFSRILHPAFGEEESVGEDEEDKDNDENNKKQKQNNLVETNLNGDSVTNSNDKKAIKSDSNDIVSTSSKQNKRVNKKKKTQKNIDFIIKLTSIFVVFFVFIIAVILGFHSTLSNMTGYLLTLNSTCTESHIFLEVHDILREYFHYPFSTEIEQTLTAKLNQVLYYQKLSTTQFSQEHLPSGYKPIFRKISNSNLCSHTGDLFRSSYVINEYLKETNCSELTGQTVEYGKQVLMAFYIEQIKGVKNLFDSKLIADDSFTENYTSFLNDYRVLQLRVLRNYFVRPIFNFITQQLYYSIEHHWNNMKTLYLALMILFIIGIVFGFFAYWVPFLLKLDKDIYRTKGLLSIIPKEVLASIENINILLNLGNNRVIGVKSKLVKAKR